MTESAAARGRRDLASWLGDQPDNFFTVDGGLQRGLRRHLGEERYALVAEQLNQQGRVIAQVVDPLVQELEYRGNLPRLERYDGIGRRV